MKRAALVLTMVVALVGFVVVGAAQADSLGWNGVGGIATFTPGIGDTLSANPTITSMNVFNGLNLIGTYTVVGSAAVTSAPEISQSGTTVTFGSGGSFVITGSVSGPATGSTPAISLPTGTTLLSGTFLSGGTVTLLGSGEYQAYYTVAINGLNSTLLSDFFPGYTAAQLAGLDIQETLNGSESNGTWTWAVSSTDVTTYTPEPGSLVLVVGALLLLAFVQRKRLGNLV